MQVILFGATGMVGQGVLRECLLDASITKILAVGRNATGQSNPKLLDVIVPNFLDYSAVESRFATYDACFFCLGVSSAGMQEAEYRQVTQGIAIAAAEALLRHNSGMTLVFVSGAGADTTERGRVMWARVKGATENALLRMPFKDVYVIRPAGIVPMHGITSRTRSYRFAYSLLSPILPALQRAFPDYITTTEQLGHVMIRLAQHGFGKKLLESRDIQLV